MNHYEGEINEFKKFYPMANNEDLDIFKGGLDCFGCEMGFGIMTDWIDNNGQPDSRFDPNDPMDIERVRNRFNHYYIWAVKFHHKIKSLRNKSIFD